MTMLWGACPEDAFSMTKHGAMMRDRLKGFHFEPGKEFSYSNTNFHILAQVVEGVSQQSLESLLEERLFRPAAMKTAKLCREFAELPKPCVGYEGDMQHGYFTAINRMESAGDAGVVASLADMVAYEIYLHNILSVPGTWYKSAVESLQTENGLHPRYSHGLRYVNINGIPTIGHSGAVRGYRSSRIHAPNDRLSVVVMLNHEVNTATITHEIIQTLLGLKCNSIYGHYPSCEWIGIYLDEGTKLVIEVVRGHKDSTVLISYSRFPEMVYLTDINHAKSQDMAASLEGDCLTIHRMEENMWIKAVRLVQNEVDTDFSVFEGDYYCADIDSRLHCRNRGGLMYGYFDGFMGKGPAQVMRYIGQNVWLLLCPRGIDAPGPGTWTLVFHRNGDKSAGVTVGCWLARRLEFTRSEQDNLQY